MGSPFFLFGAGASIDAGLSDTYGLTQQVYERLGSPAERRLLGYVIAKLVARRVKAGGSPFDKINVEDAYDGIVRLMERDGDLLSDFVYSWDPILDQIRPRFSKDRFSSLMSQAIHDSFDRRGNRRNHVFGGWSMTDAAEEIAKALSPELQPGNLDSFLSPFISTLVSCLDHDSEKIGYIKDIVRYSVNKKGSIATLNYDLIIEDALSQNNNDFDYGLSAWNDRKIVRWAGSDSRLIKLHGSVNWRGSFDKIDVTEDESDRDGPVLIFGSLRGKLIPDGPFLQLRHEMERLLRRTNSLVVIGYSFRDGHLNALIRRWVSTRLKAKLIIVDPGDLALSVETIGYPWIRGPKGEITKYTVEIEHIKKGAAEAVADILAACEKPPDPEEYFRKLREPVRVTVQNA